MGLTLLIGSRSHTWHDWLQGHLGSRDLLVLDPLHAGLGPPCRLVLARDAEVVAWRFAGATDPLRNPIDLLAGAAGLLAEARPECVALMFAWRESPVRRQLAYALARMLRPKQVLIPEGAACPDDGWPVRAERVPLEPAFPAMVLAAQRRARWMELLKLARPLDIDLARTRVLGARLGSGSPVNVAALHAPGLQGGLRAEVCGQTLLLVTREPVDDGTAIRAMNLAGASRVVAQTPEAYEGLVCSLERDDGTPVALGIVERAEFADGRLRVLTASSPAKAARVLRIGALRVDAEGREVGEVRPWSV
jgi:hypothetical protein